jgi:hypothetical protein
MSGKIAMAAHLPEHQECTSCHCFTRNGYYLRDSSMARLVCGECYSTFGSEYPLADRIVEIRREELEKIAPEGKKPGFHAGYLMGKKETTDTGFRIRVDRFIESVCAGGTGAFFNKEDALKIRIMSRQSGQSVVGLFRTSPSGSPDFNVLDDKTLDDMLLDIIYLIVGGSNEIQIAVKDKHSRGEEIGVILS